jgi:hypothetical protein
MGTAIVANAAVTLPHQMIGLHTAATVVWIFASIILVALTAAWAGHWIWHRQTARSRAQSGDGAVLLGSADGPAHRGSQHPVCGRRAGGQPRPRGRRRWGAIATGARRAHPDADTVNQSARLAEVFRAKGLPVVLVNVVGGASAHRGRPWDGVPDWRCCFVLGGAVPAGQRHPTWRSVGGC